MPSFALTARPDWLAPVACTALLALTFAAPAAPGDCGEVTIKSIQVPTRRPESCIAVQLQHATVVLDKALADAHAKGLVASHPGDDHHSRWTIKQARDLLQMVTPRGTLDSCATVDGRGRRGDWESYVALQIDEGHAVVHPTGADAPVNVVAVRERSMGCSTSLGGTSSRFYGIPGGRWFLLFLTGIS
ncbi:hypothetical protein [Roseateles sp.]|uniref:hypothetical protein n=1 Tax=Roseateles sp. TaxID=1971397 RepID=UPI003267B6AD